MKIERLRKNHKKKIVIGVVIVLALVSTITLTMSKSKYRLTQSMKLVTGIINYKVPDMRVVAVNISEDGTNYEIANEVPESGYTLNEERSICKVATETSGIENAPQDTNITIKYENNKISFYGITKRNTRCYLYFDKYVEPTSETTLAKLNINLSYIKEGTPDFSKVAIGAETEENNGIYKASDPMYGEDAETYYWRGASTTNHVIFANKCWRIIRINGDGTLRLIYNGTQNENRCVANPSDNTIVSSVPEENYYSTIDGKANNASYVGWTYKLGYQRPNDLNAETVEEQESNIKLQTDKWYNDIIGKNEEFASHVADGKYCNDRTVGSGTWSATGSTFYYAARERLQTNKTPTLGCDTEDIYILKVGAITVDEGMFAGGNQLTFNKEYYLKSDDAYWTMSPFNWIKENSQARVYRITPSGSFLYTTVGSNLCGIRPVINLRSDVTFNFGSDGTQNNPYIVQ